MTAEVAVMNTMAIALAADSAVTTVGGKIYNTANKLFELSRANSIGIMVYGASQLMGVPWETIIKEYRFSIGHKSFKTLEECADNFFEFVAGIFPQEVQSKYFERDLRNFYKERVLKNIINKIKEEIENKGSIKETLVKEIVSKIIDEFYKEFQDRPSLPIDSDAYRDLIRKKYIEIINKCINDVFRKLPISEILKNKLIEIAVNLCCKDIFPKNISGVVIAGFGKDDIFPSLIEYRIHHVLGNKLKYSIGRKAKIDFRKNAIIVPFAQSEMIQTFMEGVDPRYQVAIENLLSKFLSEFAVVLKDNIPDIEFAKKLNDFLESTIPKFKNELKLHRQTYNVQPIMAAVSSLPKEDLAALAESLVHLTSLKRKVTAGQTESVGGPIDVVVISKGDGFIWIKRKHYFEADKNPSYFIRLLSEFLTEGEENYAEEEKEGKGV